MAWYHHSFIHSQIKKSFTRHLSRIMPFYTKRFIANHHHSEYVWEIWNKQKNFIVLQHDTVFFSYVACLQVFKLLRKNYTKSMKLWYARRKIRQVVIIVPFVRINICFLVKDFKISIFDDRSVVDGVGVTMNILATFGYFNVK